MNIQTFETHGFVRLGETDTQVYGICPFCGKDRFYINKQSLLWDCKKASCGRYGNQYQFLEQICSAAVDSTPDELYQQLSQDRGIRTGILRAAGIGCRPDGVWLIPVRDPAGTTINIRLYRPGEKLRSTTGCRMGLYRAEQLQFTDQNDSVYICEGEWDTLALQDALWKSNQKGVAVGVPGAGVFQRDWVSLFSNRHITLLYDADKAGHRGAERAIQLLANAAASLKLLIWPDGTSDGWDIRDQITSIGQTNILPWIESRVVDALSRPISPTPVSQPQIAEPVEPFTGSFDDVLDCYREWIEMRPEIEDAIRIIYAVIISTPMDGEPLWVHLVSPPGGAKSVLLLSVSRSSQVICRSTITAQALISGWHGPGGSDPSLLPRLDQKTLVIKDFTEVQSQHAEDRKQLYGVLRDAYDGTVHRTFGNNVSRSYTLKFSLLTGVTHEIYAENYSSLGERFLRYQLLQKSRRMDATILRAIRNSNRETEMMNTLQETARQFLDGQDWDRPLPILPEKLETRLVSLAQIVARLRGTVERDRNGVLQCRPQYEVGTRIAKQLLKLGSALAMIRGGDEISTNDYRIMEQVAFDTCTDLNLEIFSVVLQKQKATVEDICQTLRISYDSVYPRLQDMLALEILAREEMKTGGPGRPKSYYSLDPDMADLWSSANVSAEVRWRNGNTIT